MLAQGSRRASLNEPLSPLARKTAATTPPMASTKMSQMLSVPLSRVRSPKLKRQTPVEDEIDGPQQNQPAKSIASDYESNSSRSLSPYWRIVMDPESSSSYLDVPETTNNSRRSSNNSVVRFTPHDGSDLCSILDMTVTIRLNDARTTKACSLFFL